MILNSQSLHLLQLNFQHYQFIADLWHWSQKVKPLELALTLAYPTFYDNLCPIPSSDVSEVYVMCVLHKLPFLLVRALVTKQLVLQMEIKNRNGKNLFQDWFTDKADRKIVTKQNVTLLRALQKYTLQYNGIFPIHVSLFLNMYFLKLIF